MDFGLEVSGVGLASEDVVASRVSDVVVVELSDGSEDEKLVWVDDVAFCVEFVELEVAIVVWASIGSHPGPDTVIAGGLLSSASGASVG